MKLPVSMMPTSLLVPRNVGLSANGFEYSRGSGGVKKDRVGGEYDGIFPECIGNVGDFLWPKLNGKNETRENHKLINLQ
jgi:hypothetical protein